MRYRRSHLPTEIIYDLMLDNPRCPCATQQAIFSVGKIIRTNVVRCRRAGDYGKTAAV